MSYIYVCVEAYKYVDINIKNARIDNEHLQLLLRRI